MMRYCSLAKLPRRAMATVTATAMATASSTKGARLGGAGFWDEQSTLQLLDQCLGQANFQQELFSNLEGIHNAMRI